MIYTASKVIHADKWKALRAQGYPIISTWIDEAGIGETKDFADLWRRCADEAAQASVTLLYREPGEILKGAFIEAGIALASGRPVFAIGCGEFSFVNHPFVTQFADLSAALAAASTLPSVPDWAWKTSYELAAEGRDPYGKPLATPQAVAPTGEIERPWLCDVTWNPVGTDTRMIGAPPCDCQGCRADAIMISQREHIRKQAEDIMTLGKLVYASETETWQDRATDLRRKLEEARKALAEARDHIDRYADTAVEHDLIARIDALTGGGSNG